MKNGSRFATVLVMGGILVVGLAAADRCEAQFLGRTSSGTASLTLAPSLEITEGRFATAMVCVSCHSNSGGSGAMRDMLGAPIAPFDLWQSSMMANAARDPFWWAVVSAEAAAIRDGRRVVGTVCMRCHAPMAHREAELNGEALPALGLLTVEGARPQLGLDGVSCTLCHQIVPGEDGFADTYSGRFAIAGERVLHGPHRRPFETPMLRHTGYLPRFGEHILEPGLCASCHTLFTEALDGNGEVVGPPFPEQTPYLEWRNSEFSTENYPPGPRAATCQDCHLPMRGEDGFAIDTAIARHPGGNDFGGVFERAPFGRHVLVGGNTVLPAILRDGADLLNPVAGTDAFEATIARAREQLQGRTADLALADVALANGVLELTAVVTNRTGHKFPTGHPSRRAWIRVEVFGAEGDTVFASGLLGRGGELVDGSGRPLAADLAEGALHPHIETVERADQVPVYESIMADREGRPTFLLLRGAAYAKDNRLLPAGWREDHPEAAATAPVGTAADPDFAPGGDRVRYRIPVPDGAGSYRIEAALLYQTVGARYLNELLRIETPEITAFGYYYAALETKAERVAAATAAVGD